MEIIPIATNTVRLKLEGSDFVLTIRDNINGALEITEGTIDGQGSSFGVILHANKIPPGTIAHANKITIAKEIIHS